MSFLSRIGLAITQPRWALAIASDRRAAGRSGTDVIVLIAIVLAATHLAVLAGAVWLGAAIDSTLGLHAITRLLKDALTVDLAFLVLGAFVLWLGAGPRRNLGRAFDLACVAAVPLFIVDLGAGVVVRALDASLPAVLSWAIFGLAWGWAGALIALAWRPARSAPPTTPPPPAAVLTPARRAGRAVALVAALGAVLNVVWIARNLDLIRPVAEGAEAPGFTLPTIGRDGALLAPVTLARGRVTVLDFWATWCGPCLRALPKLDELGARHPDVDVIAINLDDPARARALFDERGWTKLVLLADDGEVNQRYNVGSLPHTVVIDRAGMVSHIARGAHGDLEAAVRAALQK